MPYKNLEKRREASIIASRKYRINHPEKILENNRSEKVKESKRKYEERNKIKINLYKKKWRKENPEYLKNWIENNKERYKQLRRTKEKDYRLRNPHKVKAHNMTRNNKLRKDFCEICNSKNIKLEAHHPDYSKPNYTITLCVSCHRGVHLA